MDVQKILYEIKTAENAGEYLQELLNVSSDHDNERMMHILFEQSPAYLCVFGFDNHFKKVSKSFSSLLGYEEIDLTGLPITSLMVDSSESAGTSYIHDSRKVSEFRNQYRCKDGAVRTFQWKCVSDPPRECVYAIAEDVTAQEEERVRNQALTQLLAERDKSLEYARSLQHVLMPYESLLDSLFNQYFVLNMPREILSGNFCWVEKVNEKIYVAVADCAWNGIPGALMSVACTSALSRAINEFKIVETGKILDKVRDLVGEIFSHSDIRAIDGMDISLCCINKQTCVIEWSGANNQLLFLHNGIIQELVGDKHSIGGTNDPLPFTTHKMFLSKGDNIYLFSDGYADQFGGAAGKKMLYKKFQSLLVKLAPLQMERQKERLFEEFNKWRGEMQQDDDVLVLGLRL
jgi:PAS domain S-box-containing protein